MPAPPNRSDGAPPTAAAQLAVAADRAEPMDQRVAAATDALARLADAAVADDQADSLFDALDDREFVAAAISADRGDVLCAMCERLPVDLLSRATSKLIASKLTEAGFFGVGLASLCLSAGDAHGAMAAFCDAYDHAVAISSPTARRDHSAALMTWLAGALTGDDADEVAAALVASPARSDVVTRLRSHPDLSAADLAKIAARANRVPSGS